jgi:hypothetical protein
MAIVGQPSAASSTFSVLSPPGSRTEDWPASLSANMPGAMRTQMAEPTHLS